LIDQAQSLVKSGVKELILIAQDTTFYGKDIYGERKLPELIDQLSNVNGLEWIRIHYTYPANFPLNLLPIMRNNSKVCKYLDIPFQHASDRMLKLMRRGITKGKTIDLIDRIRTQVPGIALRTTLLVGHPGETEADFDELLEFVEINRFDRLGVFTYSHEEGTHSATLPNDVPNEVKRERMERIMELQKSIVANLNQSRIGQTHRVIIDHLEGETTIARTEFDSPEVDQEVIIPTHIKTKPKPGDFINCIITDADDYDLMGIILPKIRTVG